MLHTAVSRQHHHIILVTYHCPVYTHSLSSASCTLGNSLVSLHTTTTESSRSLVPSLHSTVRMTNGNACLLPWSLLLLRASSVCQAGVRARPCLQLKHLVSPSSCLCTNTTTTTIIIILIGIHPPTNGSEQINEPPSTHSHITRSLTDFRQCTIPQCSGKKESAPSSKELRWRYGVE
jgi:hypothetical protein